ncbi:MAG: hypothetical protein SF123_16365 [Chloroflexota bacterium]|nr:hypothetical protein [Chloroflexota bacterium]
MKRFSLLTIVVVLVMAIVGVGVVGAQPGPGGGGIGGPGGNGMGGRHGQGMMREVLTIISDATGLTEREILQQVRDGATLTEIITANGGDVQAVTDAIIAVVTEQVNEAVTNGRITQERADQILANLPTMVENVLNGEFEPGFGGPRGDRGDRGMDMGRGGIAVVRLAAEMTGVDAQDIHAQLEDGTTLEEILTSNNVDVDAFVAEAVERMDARLGVLVADGRITQAEADEMLTTFETELRERISQPMTAGAGAGN